MKAPARGAWRPPAGPRASLPSPRPPPVSVRKGRPAAGTRAFFRPTPSSSPGKKETVPQWLKWAGGARPPSAGLELGRGGAGPHSLDARLRCGQWTGPSLVELHLVRGPQSAAGLPGGRRLSFPRVHVRGRHPRPCRAGRNNFRKLLSGNFSFEGQFTFHLMGKKLIPNGLRSRVIWAGVRASWVHLPHP